MQDGLDAPYWAGLAEGKLTIQRCSRCRAWIWAPQWRCSHCGSWDLEWEAVEPSGTVFSWTRTWHPFSPELKAVTPYVVILGELPQAGAARLMGTLAGPEDALRIGARITGEIQAASEATSGVPILRWRLSTGI